MAAWDYSRIRYAMQGGAGRIVSFDSVDQEVEDFEDLLGTLRMLGRQGWEVVSILPIAAPSPNLANPVGLYDFYLKRAIV